MQKPRKTSLSTLPPLTMLRGSPRPQSRPERSGGRAAAPGQRKVAKEGSWGGERGRTPACLCCPAQSDPGRPREVLGGKRGFGAAAPTHGRAPRGRSALRRLTGPLAAARVRTTLPRMPCAPPGSWELWSGAGRARAWRAGARTTYPKMQRGAAGAGGLNGGSPARGGAASAAAGAGGCGGRGRGPGREAEAGAAGAGGGAPEAMMGKEEEIARIARRLDKMVTKKSAVRGAGRQDPGTPVPPSPRRACRAPVRAAATTRGAGRDSAPGETPGTRGDPRRRPRPPPWASPALHLAPTAEAAIRSEPCPGSQPLWTQTQTARLRPRRPGIRPLPPLTPEPLGRPGWRRPSSAQSLQALRKPRPVQP